MKKDLCQAGWASICNDCIYNKKNIAGETEGIQPFIPQMIIFDDGTVDDCDDYQNVETKISITVDKQSTI